MTCKICGLNMVLQDSDEITKVWMCMKQHKFIQLNDEIPPYPYNLEKKEESNVTR